MLPNWDTFKSTLGLSNHRTVKYIDDEGSKISIDSEIEFQEALRFAKSNNNHLKIILYNEEINHPLKCHTNESHKNIHEFLSDNLKMNDSCVCKENSPPEWFIQYMRKIQKEIVQELKSTVVDIVKDAIENDRKATAESFRNYQKKQKERNLKSFGSDEKLLVKKSGVFYKDNICLVVEPGKEFSFDLGVVNNGKLRWTAPRLECIVSNGLIPLKNKIHLPKLHPAENHIIHIEGRAANTQGLLNFKWRLIDGSETLCQNFVCWGRTDCKPSQNDIFLSKIESQETVGVDRIEKSQMKIKENIEELEKRIRDLDVIRLGDDQQKESDKKIETKGQLDSEHYDTYVVVSPDDPNADGSTHKDQNPPFGNSNESNSKVSHGDPEKTNSSEYCFTASNLTESTTFTNLNDFKKNFHNKKNNQRKVYFFDSKGKVIYAVNYRGHCVPVSDLY